MTPLQFEQLYQADWQELEDQLARVRASGFAFRRDPRIKPVDADRLSALYRRTCEHLALARARAYPPYVLDRLERLTSEAHQVIYQHRKLGLETIRRFFAHDFPNAVRRDAAYVWVAAAVFVLPMLVLGWVVHARPELILSVVDAQTAAMFEQMYSPDARAIGRRDADSDWYMFGYYIRHNITVAFQCFAGGLLLGVGSLFFLAFNGVLIGAVAGYLVERGLSATFFAFVATHGPFELTAIVLSGAAGLRIGHAVLSPKRRTRVQALVAASRESIVVVYGMTIMLVIAAAIEAFWSSSSLLAPAIKYSVATVCWIAVIGYFVFQGRRAG